MLRKDIPYLLEKSRIIPKEAKLIKYAMKLLEKAKKYYDDITAIRDQRMAENLTWLTENLYPDKKIIVWSHNYHIRKDNMKIKNNRSPLPTMSELLPERIKKDSYVIGLYMNRGESLFVDHKPAPVRYPHPESNIEWILSKSESKNIFVDLASQKYSNETSWMFLEKQALDGGAFVANNMMGFYLLMRYTNQIIFRDVLTTICTVSFRGCTSKIALEDRFDYGTWIRDQIEGIRLQSFWCIFIIEKANI